MYVYRHLVSFAGLACLLPIVHSAPARDHAPNSKRWFSIHPGYKNEPQRWPNNELRYKWATSNDRTALDKVLKAGWKLWTDNGLEEENIKLVLAEQDPRALTISAVNKPGALTTVGYREGCTMTFGDRDDYGMMDRTINMAHELGHALGLYHEHQRPDRDKYVEFHCERLDDWTQERADLGFCHNIKAADDNGWTSKEFIKKPVVEGNEALGVAAANCISHAYDGNSIMHYPGEAGSKIPSRFSHQRDVVLTNADGGPWKRNTQPSWKEVRQVNWMYSYTESSEEKRDNAIKKYCDGAAGTSSASFSSTLPTAKTSTFGPFDGGNSTWTPKQTATALLATTASISSTRLTSLAPGTTQIPTQTSTLATMTAAPSWDPQNCMAVENPRYYLSAMVCSCNNGHTYETQATPGPLGQCGWSTPPASPLTTMPIVSPTPSAYDPDFVTPTPTPTPAATEAVEPVATTVVDDGGDDDGGDDDGGDDDGGDDDGGNGGGGLIGAAADVANGAADAAGDVLGGAADTAGDLFGSIFGGGG